MRSHISSRARTLPPAQLGRSHSFTSDIYHSHIPLFFLISPKLDVKIGINKKLTPSFLLSRFNFTFPILPNLVIPLQVDTWSAFNAAGQLSQYDVTFKWWQWTVDYLLGTAAAAHSMTIPQVTAYATQKLAASICDTAMRNCNSKIVGLEKKDLYSSRDECIGFLTKEVRFGEAYELGELFSFCLLQERRSSSNIILIII